MNEAGEIYGDGLLGEGDPVEVRSRYVGSWANGFEVHSPAAEGYIIRRISDGSLLPSKIPFDDVRLDRTRTAKSV